MDRFENATQRPYTQRPVSMPKVTEEEKQQLFKTLPRNVTNPADAIFLTPEQELIACKLTCRELEHFDPRELRDVYIECSQHDKNLEGFCDVEVLDNCLRRHRAYLSNTLRIIAAQYLDPFRPEKVNYERVLSFIGSALDMQQKGQLGAIERPRYFRQDGENIQAGSIQKDREVAKLLRMVEQELSKSTYTMDWTKWQNLFYEKDRDHRETLSGPQIKEICFECNLPLSDSLMNRILSLCEDNNRDGQYRWPAFLDFLSRVRPSNTGLPIPVSKRPLEYVKHFPQPVANWPKADADAVAVERKPPKSPPVGEQAPRRDVYRQDQAQKVQEPRSESPRRERPPSRDRNEKPEIIPVTDRESIGVYSPDMEEPKNKGFTSTNAETIRHYADKYKYLMRTYSPYKNDNNRDFPTEQQRFPSPRHFEYAPQLGREQYRASAVPNDYDMYMTNRYYPSEGYKPSWQGKEPQGQIFAPPHNDVTAPDRDHRNEPRDYHNNYPAQNGSYRRMSYVEPQRNTLQDLQYDQPPGRQRTPVDRARSLSPARYVSPGPYEYRQDQPHPVPYREQRSQLQDHQAAALKNIQPQPYHNNYKLKVPYGEHFNKDARYPENHRDSPQLQYHQGFYRRPEPRRPRYADYYGKQQSFNDPARQQFPYGFQEADDTRYREQQYPLRQYPDNNYRRQDDRQGQATRIRQLSDELQQLQSKHNKSTTDRERVNELPWLERYYKLAEALYKVDRYNSGCLPRSTVLEVVRQYNDDFSLSLDMNRAHMLSVSPENLDRTGHVLLRPFLASLCGNNFKLRI